MYTVYKQTTLTTDHYALRAHPLSNVLPVRCHHITVRLSFRLCLRARGCVVRVLRARVVFISRVSRVACRVCVAYGVRRAAVLPWLWAAPRERGCGCCLVAPAFGTAWTRAGWRWCVGEICISRRRCVLAVGCGSWEWRERVERANISRVVWNVDICRCGYVWMCGHEGHTKHTSTPDTEQSSTQRHHIHT